MPKLKLKNKFKTGQVFETIADVGSLLMAFLYIVYVSLLLIFEFGSRWLNIGMLVIAFIYLAFFITKISALNNIIISRGVQRKARMILKYSKWAMKAINATFVILLITTAHHHDSGNIFMMIGVFIALFSFITSVMWDVCWFIARRKLREFRVGWEQLSREQKNARISTAFEDFLQNLDYLTGADIMEKVTSGGAQSKKIQDPQDPQSAQSQEE